MEMPSIASTAGRSLNEYNRGGHMPISIEELKNRFPNLTDEDNKENISEIASFDYVLENTDGSFQTASLNISKSTQHAIIEQIKNKIDGYSKASLIDFDFTKELGKNQIGVMDISACPERLSSMLAASNQPNRESLSLPKKYEKLVVAYIITIIDGTSDDPPIKVIKKLHLYNILSSNKKKPRIGLVKGAVTSISEKLVITAPESFDVIVSDDTVFVLKENNFNFLFGDRETLKKKVIENKEKLETIIDNPDDFVANIASDIRQLRGLYHVLTIRTKIKIDNKKLEWLEGEIKKKTGTQDAIFQRNDEKIKCTKENSKYVYWLLANRYIVTYLNGDLYVAGSVYNIK